MTYRDTQEARRDALEMERNSIFGKDNTEAEMEDIIRTAINAVSDGARHSKDSLFLYLGYMYPEASDDQILEAVDRAL
jgi:hypothetical protein